MKSNFATLQFNKDLDLMATVDDLSRWKNDDQSLDSQTHVDQKVGPDALS